MARRYYSSRSTTSSRTGLPHYYLRLKPLVEFEYDTQAGKALEIVAYDDREATGEIKVQFFPITAQGHRVKGKNCVLTAQDAGTIEEMAADLADLAALLRDAE